MTDRELLEAAAMAIGLILWSRCDPWTGDDSFPSGLLLEDGRQLWNPLTDDGDALRLLLKLQLRVDYVGSQPCINGVLQSGTTVEESFRRAVVRAATAREFR
jgi:hypothetical protein